MHWLTELRLHVSNSQLVSFVELTFSWAGTLWPACPMVRRPLVMYFDGLNGAAADPEPRQRTARTSPQCWDVLHHTYKHRNRWRYKHVNVLAEFHSRPAYSAIIATTAFKSASRKYGEENLSLASVATVLCRPSKLSLEVCSPRAVWSHCSCPWKG